MADEQEFLKADRVALALESLMWALCGGEGRTLPVLRGIEHWHTIQEGRAALAEYFQDRLPADPRLFLEAKNNLRLRVEQAKLVNRAERLAGWKQRMNRGVSCGTS